MAVTILDVARAAGVSKSTVSLVLNHPESVKLVTRYKVEEAIAQMGYTPNLAARELTTKKKNTLGLVFLTSNHHQKAYAFSSVCETLLHDASNGIYKQLQNTDYTLLVERFSMAGEEHAVPGLVQSRRLDGLFLIGGLFTQAFMQRLQAYGLPTVIIGRQYPGVDSVAADAEEAGRMGIHHLLARGCRKIAFMNGPEASENSGKKLRGAIQALAAAQAPEGALQTVFAKGFSGLEGYQALQSLWDRGFVPDGVFGASDGLTAGAMRFLYEKGLQVPRQVAVLGYEDSILSEYAAPALSVIDAHKEKMGEEACKMLLSRIKKPRAKPMELLIAPSLILREST